MSEQTWFVEAVETDEFGDRDLNSDQIDAHSAKEAIALYKKARQEQGIEVVSVWARPAQINEKGECSLELAFVVGVLVAISCILLYVVLPAIQAWNEVGCSGGVVCGFFR